MNVQVVLKTELLYPYIIIIIIISQFVFII